jgi:hypothetical protein
MGLVRTIKGEDGRPYVALDDLIKEVQDVRKSTIGGNDNMPNFIDVVIHTLTKMETEYYEKFLFKNNN